MSFFEPGCRMIRGLPVGLLALLVAGVSMTVGAGTLQDVQKRGELRCGVNQGLPGFSDKDGNGRYQGLDVDYCKAVAAAIFNDTSAAVEYVPLSASRRFEALTGKDIDLLARNTTWTMSRDAEHGEFIGISYYDGQGFMVPKSLGVHSAQELDNARVCVNTGTTTELNAVDYFSSLNIKVRYVKFENTQDVVDAYDNGDCDVFTTDRSGLAAQRGKLADPEAHRVLPEIISKEPLGPVVRQDDAQWADIARWSLFCLINAEELGVSRRNVNQHASRSDVPAVRRLLGLDGEFGQSIGLDDKWCYNIIARVGNYAEIYERNVGPETPLQLKRGVNALWSNGGILYAPPIR